MKKNVLHKNNSRERIHYSKLWWCLALGAFLFTFSCKQANTGRGHEPTISDEIIITVSGDVGITVNTLNTIKVKKSSTWKDIKQKAIEKITTKEDKEIKEWRIKDAKGRVLKYTDVFEKDTIVFAVSKNKESPTPPAKPLTITIEIDEGYTFKDINKPCTIEVQKGSTWSSIKAKAETKIELKDGYEKTGWKLGSKDGGYLEDSIVFDKNVFIFATSKKKGELDKPKIIITVKGDEGVEFGSPDNFTVDSGSKWASIKTQVIVIAKPKQNFEIDTWHLNNADGTLINDEMEFKENITIFAVSKRKVVQYKVEHLKENIEDENYTKTEEEAKTGEAGKNTEAVTKQYEGFSCQGLAQEVIKADGSTVVQIKYKRNRVFLVLDLAGGKTTPALEDETDGRKLLKGKFEARVEVKGLAKENYGFEKWEPTLPEKFPAMSSTTTYTAKWTIDSITITVEGDENVVLGTPNTKSVAKGAKWTEIKTQVMSIASAKEDFEIKEWHLNNADGTLINDETEFKANITVFAVSKRKVVQYKVKHLKENIENEEFTEVVSDEEAKIGEAGRETQAVAKQYEGFVVEEFSQNLIKVDGSTVVQIKYRRKITSLIIDLQGGSTTTKLIDEDGKKLLKGKFGARVEVENLTKENHNFEKWEPMLPQTFLATSTATIYTAKWKKNNITITVKGDEGIKINSANTFTVDSVSKWADIKVQAEDIITIEENFEFVVWHENDESGSVIKDDKVFKSNATVFAVSKRKVVQYKVEHLKENIEDENYTKTEEEAKTGEAGKNTEAVTKQYEGFSCQGLAQEVIKADGSTVVQIKYKRKITSLIIDLQGGSTTTKLTDEDGKKLLKGKFGARVEVENLTKENHNFEKWEPTLPQTFPKEDDSQTTYTAKWKELTIRIKILGDERIQVTEPQYIDVSIGNNKTFGDIKAEVLTKVSLKPEWPSDNYEIYDWRVSGEEGEKVINSTQITNGMTIYARTNYSRLQITCYTPETCKLERIEGDNPRGRIFIHENVVTIKNEVFRNCRKLTAVDFSACSKLKEISAYLFEDCDSLKTVNFRGCSELTKIREYAFRGCKALEGMIDLSSCTRLETIEQNAFASSDKLVVKLPKSITEIDFYAFSNLKFKCEKVLVPNETIKQLVIDSTYPEDRIELYH